MSKYVITINTENTKLFVTTVFADDETTAFLLAKSEAEKLGIIIPNDCWLRTEKL